MAYVLKSNKRTVVPWFSMCEWEEVYKNVYSGDPMMVKKGYEKMLMWKTRTPSLPAGIECTLSLIHVWLQDRELGPQIASGLLPPYREHDLRLMFSTAIMRFLNQIAIVAQDGAETMYKMAHKLHIPDWVVTIRHDVAHGLSMPPLAVLREAMQFSLLWIHEHYWKGETELTQNFVADIDDAHSGDLVNTLIDFIELWQALKVYEQSDHVKISSIPDEGFKLRLKMNLESNLEKGCQLLHSKTFPRSDGTRSDGTRSESSVILNNCTTLELLDQIMNQLKTFLSTNKKSIDIELLVKRLLESETFVPDKNTLSALYMDGEERNESLPNQLRNLWHEILLALQTTNIVPILLKKLIDLISNKEHNIHRRQVAGLWVKELCLAIAKVQQMQKLKAKYYRFRSEKNLSKNTEKRNRRILMSEFIEIHPELCNVISLQPTHLPDIDIKFVQQTMLIPSKWMCIFLPSLLDLVQPALTNEVKKSLYNLLTIYNSEEKLPYVLNNKHEMYTVEMLLKKINNENNSIPIAVETDELTVHQEVNLETNKMTTTEQSEKGWIESKGYLEWENCPLGILPWQRDLLAMDFSLGGDISWTSSQPIQAFENLEGECNFLPKKINWEDIELSKRSKKQKRCMPTLVKNAFEAVGFSGIEQV